MFRLLSVFVLWQRINHYFTAYNSYLTPLLPSPLYILSLFGGYRPRLQSLFISRSCDSEGGFRVEKDLLD